MDELDALRGMMGDGIKQTRAEKPIRKKGGGVVNGILSNAALIAAVMSAFLLFMEIFAPVDIRGMEFALQMTADAVVTIIAYLFTYATAQRQGAIAGRKAEEYVDAKAEATALAEEAMASGSVEELQEYCDWYIAEERKRAVRRFLSSSGLKPVLVEAWEKRGRTDVPGAWSPNKKERKIIALSEKIKPISMTEAMLLCEDGDAGGRGFAPVTAKKAGARTMSTTVISTVVIVLSSGAIYAEPGQAVSAAAVVLFLFKLLCLAWRVWRGLAKGRDTYTVYGANYCRWQSRQLKLFRTWKKTNQERGAGSATKNGGGEHAEAGANVQGESGGIHAGGGIDVFAGENPAVAV